jgi:hypothetical protein
MLLWGSVCVMFAACFQFVVVSIDSKPAISIMVGIGSASDQMIGMQQK